MSAPDSLSSVKKEEQFHDQWAAEIDPEKIEVSRYFHGSTCPENRFIIEKLGDLRGKRILELGCGAGENSVFFALQGAQVTATDISSGMLTVALQLAKKYGVAIETAVVNAMEIDFEDNTFDVVYAANTFHHVDSIKALEETYRILKPGGFLCSWDPLCHNPIINVYRRMATQVRTVDEHPLSIHFIEEVKRRFTSVEYDTFWFFSLWIFIRFYFIERVNPNRERYWKKIIFEESRLRATYLQLEKLDRLVKCIPFLRRYAWNLAIVARK